MNITDLIALMGLALHEKAERDSSVKFEKNNQYVVFSAYSTFVSVGIFEIGKEVRFFYIYNHTPAGELVNLRNAIYEVIK
jgi:hypothetical protein